jgi:uncharacterized DUF497 family protein
MVNRRRFTPSDFEYDFDSDELAAHHVVFEEAVDCFFHEYEVRRNKPGRYGDRHQLIGRTQGGRRLKIIFQLKPGNAAVGGRGTPGAPTLKLKTCGGAGKRPAA